MQDMSVQENPQSVLNVDVDIDEINDLRNSMYVTMTLLDVVYGFISSILCSAFL